MKQPGSIVTSADGTRIAYDVEGSGPLVVSIFGAICHRNFDPVKGDVKALSRHFKVINYDRRGRGDSAESSDWSLERELEDLEALIAANGGKAILYGHSSGAVLALEATLKLGAMVERAIVYDPSYVGDQADKDGFLRLESEVRAWIAKDRPGRALRVFLRGIGMPRFFVALLPFLPGWDTMKALAPTLLYDMALTHDYAPVDRFRSINRPVLLLAGGKNPPSILQVHESLRQAIPDCQSEILENQDHMANMKFLIPYFLKFVPAC
jgi:pimeloyl-ACP methyl ester carboxylesterase